MFTAREKQLSYIWVLISQNVTVVCGTISTPIQCQAVNPEL